MATARAAERYILRRISNVLEAIDVPQEAEVVDLIGRAKQIFVYGAGRSSLVARAFAMRLVQLGFKVFFIGDATTPIVEKGDLVFIVSRTGETMSAVQTANICRRVGATVVTITAQRTSKLSHASSIVLHLKEDKDQEASSLAPLGTIFEDAALVFLDGFIAQLMKQMGQTEAEMRARHAIMV